VMRDEDGPAIARLIKDDRLAFRIDGLEVAFALPRLAAPILARIDGRTSLAALCQALSADIGARADRFDQDFARLYKVMNGIGRMMVRRPLT
jgi:hypothetical protein